MQWIPHLVLAKTEAPLVRDEGGFYQTHCLVDPEGLEPSTPTMPLWCAPNCATGP
jgi:hypothetical protein